MLIALSGSREFSDRDAVWRALALSQARFGDDLRLSFGDARGLDSMVWEWAMAHLPRQFFERHVCEWPKDPSTKQQRFFAAHERNLRVIGVESHTGPVDMLLAFFGPTEETPGTTDAIKIARRESVEIRVYRQWTGKWRVE